MPRGATYDNGIPQSDNAIEAVPTKAHGTNPGSDVDRSYKAVPIPEERGANELHSGLGSHGPRQYGNGLRGRNPKTLGERKGLGAHKA